MNTKLVLSLTLCLVCTVGAYAQSSAKEDSPRKPETAEDATGSVQGRVSMPVEVSEGCLLYTSPSPRDATLSRMPSSA